MNYECFQSQRKKSFTFFEVINFFKNCR